jgi:hypothetical protein
VTEELPSFWAFDFPLVLIWIRINFTVRGKEKENLSGKDTREFRV